MLPAVIDEATWPTHMHGALSHRHNAAIEGHVHGIDSQEAAALELMTECIADALQAEFGTFLGGEREDWMKAALGILTKMRGTITSGGEGLAILTLQRAN